MRAPILLWQALRAAWARSARPLRGLWFAGLLAGCGGSAWIDEPLPDSDAEHYEEDYEAEATPIPPHGARPARPQEPPPEVGDANVEPRPVVRARRRLQGRVLGKFRNTYYDFPAERDHQGKGEQVALMNARCETVKMVPRSFYDAVCVQGSGTLATGVTVSFARRDCECAAVCPRSGQKICFDQLDGTQFPWGRGATGRAITPLLTVAVDSDVIPLDTPIYIPEYDGLPRDVDRTSFHDGCFIAQDRGIRIKGKQVDIFTGHESVTRLWNKLVPSNQGVTVVLDNPRCARARE
jgi:3D (Asp-Asp-Asp) domain-containing protein